MRVKTIVIILFSFFLVGKTGFCISKEDSLLVDSKVDKLKDLINSNSDSTSFYLLDLKREKNKYALLQFKFLSGFIKIREGKFRKAIRLFEEYINLTGDSLSSGSIDQLNRIAMCYKHMGNDSASIYYEKALKLAKKASYNKGVADSYTGIAQVAELKGNYKTAMELYLQSYSHFKKITDTVGLSTTLNNIGNVMYYQADYEKALEYYKRSAEFNKKRGDEHTLASSYGNIGMIYKQLGNLDSALFYNLECMKLFEKMQSTYALGSIYNNVALVYYDLKQFDKSLEYQLKSKKIKETIGDKNGLTTTLINIGNLYVERREYKTAEEYFLMGIEGALELESRLFEMEAHKGLAKVYRETEEFEQALLEYIKYSEIEDSLNNIEARNKVAELETRFETAQKKKEIAQLEKEKQANELALIKKTNQRNAIIAIMAFLLIGLVFSYFYWRQKQISNSKTIALNKEKIDSLQKQNKINYANAMIEGQEAERKRLAKDLHDRLGSILSTMKLHLSSISEESIEKVNSLLDKSVEEVRKISHNLASISLVKFGLVASLQSLSESITSDDLKVSFIHHGIDERLPSKVAIALYRCVQELVSNIIKHADASKVTIQLQKNNDQINLIVEDNGKGFDPSKEPSGIGLKNIRSRINSINGEIDFDSLPQKGTTVIIDVPIKS